MITYYLDIECMPKHNKILVLEKCRLKDYVKYTVRTLQSAHLKKSEKSTAAYNRESKVLLYI